MFPGFSEDTVRFLLDIRFNNNKAFMEAHRSEYQRVVQEPFFALIEDLTPAVIKIDPDMEVRPRKVLSRINRDTRFSKDKSPYRDHHWLAFRKSGLSKDGQPFFWLEFGPDNLSWGAGIWGEDRSLFNALRRRILQDPEGVKEVLAHCEKHRFSIGGDTFRRLKIPPQVPEPLRPLFCSKSLYFEPKNIRYEWAFSTEMAKRAARDFRALTPAWEMMCRMAQEASDETLPDPSLRRAEESTEDIWT